MHTPGHYQMNEVVLLFIAIGDILVPHEPAKNSTLLFVVCNQHNQKIHEVDERQ